jgi:hypothetical protein
MPSRHTFRRNEPPQPGTGHPGDAAATSPGSRAPGRAPSSSPGLAGGPRAGGTFSPLPKQVERAVSLEDFHRLVRQHQADRIYLDVLDHPPDPDTGELAALHVVLSALRSHVCILATLPIPADQGGGSTDPENAISYLGVLRSRFLFLCYATCPGLASVRLARELRLRS